MKALPPALVAIALLAVLTVERVRHLNQHGDSVWAVLAIIFTGWVTWKEVHRRGN